MEAADSSGFWDLVQENHDDLKWCGSAPIYTFLKAVPQARGKSSTLPAVEYRRPKAWSASPAWVFIQASLPVADEVLQGGSKLISIRKSVNDLEHLDDLEALSTTILDSYAMAINASAHYSVEFDSNLSLDFRKNLQGIEDQVRAASSP